MYRLMLYGLTGLAFISIIFGFIGLLPYGGISYIFSFFILALVCYSSNQIFAKFFKVQTNVESEWITGFILFFVAPPAVSWVDVKILFIVAVLAMASKYFLVWKKKHIFNPVAIAVFIMGIFGSGVGAWWVGSSVLLIPIVILGFLVLRKVRRFSLFFSFLVAGFISIMFFGYMNGLDSVETLKQIFTSWPIFFFGSIMLTEPLTTPPTRKLQVIYGAIVGVFFGSQWGIHPLYSTPELALIIGNVFSYIVSPRARLILTLVRKERLTADILDFVWKSDEKLSFKPGQYLEWTLGHQGSDTRGNRRYFTIASSPTEENIYLGTKFYPNPSTFKQKLLSLETGSTMIASQLSGEFTMPEDKSKKLVFIAGGIGITPFRSMAKYMIDTKERRDVFMFYSVKTPNDLAYKDILDRAEEEVGLKNIYVVNELTNGVLAPNMRVGFINAEMITSEVPDYKERIFYISGTHGMVSMFEDTLKKLGVPKSQIKVDFFPGFV